MRLKRTRATIAATLMWVGERLFIAAFRLIGRRVEADWTCGHPDHVFIFRYAQPLTAMLDRMDILNAAAAKSIAAK